MASINNLEFHSLKEPDLETIQALESFNQPFQWHLSSYQMAFRNRWNVYGAFSDNELLSVIVYRFVADECTLMNLFVAKDAHGQGVANQQLLRLKQECESSDISHIFLEVRGGNLAAISLYEKFGFQEFNRREDYYHYDGRNYDAIDMGLHLTCG